MKYIITLFIILAYLPVWGQPNRKTEIEKCAQQVYSIKEFQRIADSIQMSISDLFGMRYHPVYKKRKFHTGIDIPKAINTPVYATGNGVVVRKGYSSGYGYYIEIEHAGGFRSFYAHLSKTMVNIGDPVSIAMQIACVGNTGVSTGPHLHYEVRKGKRYLNPIAWCGCLFSIMNKFQTKRIA